MKGLSYDSDDHVGLLHHFRCSGYAHCNNWETLVPATTVSLKCLQGSLVVGTDATQEECESLKILPS